MRSNTDGVAALCERHFVKRGDHENMTHAVLQLQWPWFTFPHGLFSEHSCDSALGTEAMPRL